MKFWLLLLLLVLPSFIGWAEPLYPLLTKLQVDSLRNKLEQTPPNVARVELLLRLSRDLIAKTESAGARADSAYAIVRQAQALSKSLHFTDGELSSDYSSGWLLCNTGKPADGRKIIQATLDRSRQRHNISQEALGWYYLGTVMATSPAQMSTRLNCFTQAARCYGLVHDLTRQAYCLKEVADMHFNQGRYMLAKQELLHVVALYRRSGSRRLHYTFDLLASTNLALSNYKDALEYEQAAIKNAIAVQDTAMLPQSYMLTVVIYWELNNFKRVDEYLQLFLHLAERNHNYTQVYDASYLIAKNLIKMQHPYQALKQILRVQSRFPPRTLVDSAILVNGRMTCYLASKQYKLAAKDCQQLREQAKRLPDGDVIRGRAYDTIARFYVVTHQYDKARGYISKNLIETSNLFKSNREDMYLLLFKVDSAQNKLKDAIADYQHHKALHDSIFNEKNSKQIAGLEIEYDTRDKEQNIALLTKQSLLQQMTIRQRGFQRNAFIIGTALLLLVLGLGYNRYRLGQRSNRLLEEKQQVLEAQQAEISQQNQSLEQVVGEKEVLLTEKEWMLKEIHHRVKNNLQVISSLLTNQSNYLRDPLASAAIRESRNRVQAMALIHQRLYQTDTLARVNMAAYVREIVNSLLESFDRFETVTVQLNVAAVELEIALATPLGLIVNEAVTNVLKYAFPPPGRGTLTIALTQEPAHHYQLTIADDGVGLPPDFDLDQSHSLGLTIIKGLSTQIRGELRLESNSGVHVSLQFEAAKS
jgi:two-component sensor histidine kinase